MFTQAMPATTSYLSQTLTAPQYSSPASVYRQQPFYHPPAQPDAAPKPVPVSASPVPSDLTGGAKKSEPAKRKSTSKAPDTKPKIPRRSESDVDVVSTLSKGDPYAFDDDDDDLRHRFYETPISAEILD
jgi:hypothetical protein